AARGGRRAARCFRRERLSRPRDRRSSAGGARRGGCGHASAGARHQSLIQENAMSITAERKQELIREYAMKDGDTGSPEVQVAILSERIRNLTGHLGTHS